VLSIGDGEIARELDIRGEAIGRVLLERIAARNFKKLAAYQEQQPLLHFAYSVKTNPAELVLKQAAAAGLFAEVISPQELESAVRAGFTPAHTIYNGPIPAHTCAAAPAIIFADSADAYARDIDRFPASLIGIRVRPPGISSRFGITEDEIPRIIQITREQRRTEVCVSFHVRPQDYTTGWRSLVHATVALAVRYERESGARVVAFDIGGGKRPEEFDQAIEAGDFDWLQSFVAAALPGVTRIFAEPGQALATPLEAVFARILEVRQHGGKVDIVIDAGYPDLPQLQTFTHRLFIRSARGLTPISHNGSSCILGRTCLEYDIIAQNVTLPEDLAVGDRIVIADCGAYDASMRFAFARGS
jgi:diaminopimelate decarboxylase